ncbi:hypothetical protein CTRI78_v006633 [Colletotrichum trifolii]|uniref:Uncharacterized protein n=1 Tax=Colletotrichum trifolii TaxID=5466 RepID=A0A4V3HW90_COLTR|nr:hypothetical protein CTRI78_v006633 [Colletotrichum trifolii]
MRENPSGGPFPSPFDVVRQKSLYTSHDLQVFLEQETSGQFGGDWEKVPAPRIKALTQRDVKVGGLPAGGRTRVPETITFHPLWISSQRARSFGGWNDDDLEEVTKLNALDTFKKIGAGQNPRVDIRPVDGLLKHSFTANVLHELFHLTYFGEMMDARNGAYGWANNVKNKDVENPDLYALIAAVIELIYRDGKKYSVSEEGEVSFIESSALLAETMDESDE